MTHWYTVKARKDADVDNTVDVAHILEDSDKYWHETKKSR